jgi:hypothetical protein
MKTGLGSALQAPLGVAMGQIAAMYGYRPPQPPVNPQPTTKHHDDASSCNLDDDDDDAADNDNTLAANFTPTFV